MTKAKAPKAVDPAEAMIFDGQIVKSKLERAFISAYMERYGELNITPRYQYKAIEKRRFMLDFAWPEFMVAVEIQGGVFSRGRHGRGMGISLDFQRHNLLTLAGWTVLYYTPDRLRGHEIHLTTKEVLTLIASVIRGQERSKP